MFITEQDYIVYSSNFYSSNFCKKIKLGKKFNLKLDPLYQNNLSIYFLKCNKYKYVQTLKTILILQTTHRTTPTAKVQKWSFM